MGSKVLIMGLTYKEDVPDTRESPVKEIVHELKEYKVQVFGCDPLLPDDVIRKFGAEPVRNLDRMFDAVIIAGAHEQFRKMTASAIRALMKEYPVLVDVRGMLAQDPGPLMEGYYRKL